jgi:hypothetical protein
MWRPGQLEMPKGGAMSSWPKVGDVRYFPSSAHENGRGHPNCPPIPHRWDGDRWVPSSATREPLLPTIGPKVPRRPWEKD